MKTFINSLSPSKSTSEVPRPTPTEQSHTPSATRQSSVPSGTLPRVSSQNKLPAPGGSHSRSNSMSTIGSSDDLQALRQEVSRLADENANLTAKLDIAPKSTSEVRDMCRKLQADNRRLTDAMERRTILGKQNVGSEELYRLREENKVLRDEKARLQLEMEKVTKVATLVGSRLAKLVMDARRSTSGNTQLVEELKRYNRRLEIENDRLYNIIQITSSNQNMDARHLAGLDTGSGASEAGLSDRQAGLNGLSSAELMRKLESSQSRLQEDMSKLSRDADNLQNLSGARVDMAAFALTRSEASSVAPPRTPNIFEEEPSISEDLRAQNARFADEIERLRDDLSTAHNSAEQLDISHTADKAKLKRQVQEMTAASVQAETDRRELQEAVDELEAQGLQMQRELHAAREFREEAERLEEENTKLCRDMNKAMEEHALLTDQLVQAESSCSAVQHRLQQLEETLQQALLVNEQRSLTAQEQASVIQRLERKCGKHERALASLRTEKEELRTRSSDLTSLSSQHSTLQTQLSEAQAARDELAQSKAGELAEVTGQLTALQQERDEMAASNADAIARLSAYVTALEREKYELLDAKAMDEADMNARVVGLRQQMEVMTHEKSSQTIETSAQVSALQRQRDELVSSRAAQAAEMSAKISALHAEKEELTKGRSDREAELVARISSLDAERSGMAATQAAELADMSGQVAALQSQVASWEELKGSHFQLNSQLAKLQREKAALVGDQERTRLGFEAATVELAQNHATQLHKAGQERKALQEEVVTLRSHASELESQSSELGVRLSFLSEQRALTEEQSANELTSLRSSKSNLEGELGRMRSHLSQVEAKSSSTAGELERRHSSLLQKHQSLESQSSLVLAEKQQQEILAAAELSSLKDANSELEAEVDKLRQHASELEQRSFATRAELHTQTSKLMSDKQDLEQQSAAQVQQLTASNAQLSKDLGDVRGQISSMQAEALAVQSQHEAKVTELLSQHAQLSAHSSAQVEQLQAHSSTLQEQLDEIQSAALSQENTASIARDQLQAQIASLTAEDKELRAQHVEQAATLRASIAELQDQNAELRKQAASQASASDAEQQQLTQRLDQVERGFQAELSELHSAKADANEQCAQLQGQLAEQENLRSTAEKQLEKLQAERQEREAVLASLTSEHEAKLAQLLELEAQVSQQSTAHANREAQLKALGAQHNERGVEIARLEDEMSKQQERFDRMQTHHDAVVAQLHSDLDRSTKEHSELKSASSQQLQQSKSDAAALSAQMFTLRRQRSNIHSQSSTTAADLAASRAIQEELREQLEAAQHEHTELADSLSRQMETLSKQNQELRASHDEVHHENGQLSLAYDELQANHTAYTAAQQARNIQLAQVMLALEEQQSQLGEDKEQLQQEVGMLREGAAFQKDEQSSLLSSLASIAQVQRPEEVASVLADLQQRVSQLTSEASQAEHLREGWQSLVTANHRLSRQLAELKSTGTYSPADSTATNTPAEVTPPMSHHSSSSEDLYGRDSRKDGSNGERPLHMRNGSAKTIQSPFQTLSQMPPPPTPAQRLPTRASNPVTSTTPLQALEPHKSDLANGSSAKGKLKFWKRTKSSLGGSKKGQDSAPSGHPAPDGATAAEKEQPEQQRQTPVTPSYSPSVLETSQMDLEEGANMLNRLASEHVQSAYDQYVDNDDVDGFMTKLGFTGFCPPTQAHDLEGAFEAALGVVEPDSIPADVDEWDKAMATSARALLATWRGLALGSSN